MSEVRKRTNETNRVLRDEPTEKGSSSSSSTASHNKFKITDALRILGGLVLLNCALSYFVTNNSVTWGWRPWFTKPSNLRVWMSGPLRLTDLELTKYDGTDPSKPIYLALNGTIYDVSANPRMYGPGGSYHFFAGRDATRAFVTGCFDTDLTPDLRGAELAYMPVDSEQDVKTMTKAELKMQREKERRIAKKRVQDTIGGWAKMFTGNGGKEYFKVGEVKRAPGWEDKLPKRELCQRAQEARPTRGEK